MAVLILGIPLIAAAAFAYYLEWWKWNAEMADRRNKEAVK